MNAPIGKVLNKNLQTVDGTVQAEVYFDGTAVTALNPLPTSGGGGGGGGAVTVADGADVALGVTTAAEATGNGSVVAILKRLRTLLNGGLPAALGANGALKVEGVASGTAVPVSGTFWQATQPVSGTVTANAGTGPFPVSDNGGSLTVDGTFWQATQAVSAASLPLPTGASTDAQITTSVGAQADAEATGNGSTIGLLKRLRTLLNGGLPAALGAGGGVKVDGSGTALPVSGTFWQATQPVSGTVTANAGTGPFPVSDNGGSLTVDGTFWQATQPVSGTFWQATQPVSLATNTPDVTDRAARLLGVATLGAGTAAIGHINELRAATTTVTVTAATGVAATLTLPAAGAGLFHYITGLDVRLYSTAARTGGATPILVTTTNITGSPVFTFATAAAVGTTDLQQLPGTGTVPVKSAAANTATTVVAPIVTGGIWRITATYFTAV